MFEITDLASLAKRMETVGLRWSLTKVVCDECDLDTVKSLVGEVEHELTRTNGNIVLVYEDY